MTEPECGALLNGAARCLLIIADPFTTPPSGAAAVLWAAGLLTSVGATPTRPTRRDRRICL